MKSKIVSRKNDIDVLFEIIDNRDIYKENSENGLVILLNGSWGSGKTTFLNELEKNINESENYELFSKYNSYEYDFYDNAYLPFFASIEDKIHLKSEFNNLIKCTSKNLLYGSITSAYSIINSLLKKNFELDLNDITNNLMGIQNEEYLQDFKVFKKCKENVIHNLEKTCKKKPQIFIIDELDRCKPNFAMDTLEIVKHFFDVKNCVFIIAVDKLQLEESVKTIYGQEMNVEKYFSKFFDYQYNLFTFSFDEIIDASAIKDIEEIVKRSSGVFNYLNVSIRDSKKIFSDFVYKYRKYSKGDNIWTADQSLFVIFLLTLKYVDLLFYTELMNGNYYRIKNKVTNNYNSAGNNYNKLLDINIGNNKTFNYACEQFTAHLNDIFIDIMRINIIELGQDSKYNRLKEIGKILSIYIPQIEPNITYKKTIQIIVN